MITFCSDDSTNKRTNFEDQGLRESVSEERVVVGDQSLRTVNTNNGSKFKRYEGHNSTATHYIHMESVEQVGGKYEITYWDYGDTHQVTMDSTQFFWSVYGMIEIPRTHD